MSNLRGAVLGIMLIWVPLATLPQDRAISLAVSPILLDSGFTKFLLPRFSLKTGIIIETTRLPGDGVIPDGADIVISGSTYPDSSGSTTPVWQGLDQIFYATQIDGSAEGAGQNEISTRFIEWLQSDVGQRTIGQFQVDGAQPFEPVQAGAVADIETVFSGNQLAGEGHAYAVCGRCHVIGERNRMKGLGSTPSFALLRTFEDWQNRFESFFALNPHPSFSQVTGVTAPFDPNLPPPISPIILTRDQLNDIIAFVATIEPADLGAPIQHQ